MPFFAALVAAVKTFAAAASAWIGAASATQLFFARLAVGMVLNVLARALMGDGDQRRAGITGKIEQGADLPRAFILGLYATAGSLVYRATWGSSGGTPNAFYTRVTVLSDLPIKSVEQLWIDGTLCTIDWENPDTELGRGFPVVEYSETRTEQRMVRDDITEEITWVDEEITEVYAWFKYYDGTQTEADSFLTSQVTTPERPWDATEVGTGVAYAVMTFRINPDMFLGFPQVIFAIDGCQIPDPDSGVAGNADHIPLAQIHYILSGISYGGQWFYGPQAGGAGLMVDAEWGAEIAKCKAPVPGADLMSDPEKTAAFGSTTVPPRYRSGLEVKVDTEIAETIEDLISACNGRIGEVAGRYRVQVGDPGTAVVSISDGDLLTNKAHSYSEFLPLAETINGVTASYPEPSEVWQNQDAPPYYVPGLEAEDGGRRLTTQVDLRAVPYKEQVQRLMKSAVEEARRAEVHNITVPPRYFGLEPGDYIDWTSARNAYTDKLFRVDGVVDLPSGDLMLDVTGVDPADYGWSAASDYVAPPQAGTLAPAIAAGAISSWSVEPVKLKDSNGIARIAALGMFWQIADAVSGLSYEVRLPGSDTLVAHGFVPEVETGGAVISGGILPNTAYEVRARFIFTSGRRSDWTGWTAATSPQVVDGARAVALTASEFFIQYDAAGANPVPGTTTLTADPINALGAPHYELFVNGVSAQAGTSASFDYTLPAALASLPVNIRVDRREDGGSGDVLASDLVQIFGEAAGSAARFGPGV